MANEQNLIPMNKRTKKQQREIAKSGGVASGIARKEKRELRDILIELLHCKNTEGITTKEALGVALINKALQGDVKAFQCIQDTIGENTDIKPQETLVIKIKGAKIDD